MFETGPKTVPTAPKRHVPVNPSNGHHQVGPVGPVRANSGQSASSGMWLELTRDAQMGLVTRWNIIVVEMVIQADTDCVERVSYATGR
jgi:hypothetical protein